MIDKLTEIAETLYKSTTIINALISELQSSGKVNIKVVPNGLFYVVEGSHRRGEGEDWLEALYEWAKRG